MGVRFPPPAQTLRGLLVLAILLAGCTPYTGEPGLQNLPSDSSRVHWVSRGETLWSISRRYGLTLQELTRANRISDASEIEVGQKLVIPEGRRSAPRPAKAEPAISLPASLPAWSGLPGSEEFIWPVQGKVISIFGARRAGRVNKGVDIQAAAGSEVRATRGGRVTFVHEALPGFGKTIIVEHPDGFASVYAYVSQILVRSGDPVAQRQVIARVGSTGRAEVPALHFEIRRHQKPQNPLHYLP